MPKIGLRVGVPEVLDSLEPIEIIDDTSGLKAAFVERYAIHNLPSEWDKETEGFYVLLSEIKPDNSFTAYVGKTDWSFARRLRSHNDDPNKTFWRLAILFKKNNGEFQSNQTSYMEGQLVSALSSSPNVRVTNSKPTGDRNFSEWDKPYMDTVLLAALRILFLRGYRNAHLGTVTKQLETEAKATVNVTSDVFLQMKQIVRGIKTQYPESQKSYQYWASNANLNTIIAAAPQTREELAQIKLGSSHYTKMIMLAADEITSLFNV